MTDNEIIKALGRCLYQRDVSCDNSPNYIMKNALDLINRKMAEIEKLNFVRTRDAQRYDKKIAYQVHANRVLHDLHHKAIMEVKELEDKLKTAKAEAIKEFAERLNKEAEEIGIDREGDFVYSNDNIYDTVADWCKDAIDNLVNEMVGDSK